jgi:ubiquitin-conjugating enzyme E2 variant
MAAVTWRRPGEFLCGSAILLAACLTAVHALRLAAGVDAQGLPFALAGVVLGALAVDGASGLVHWACDTWGDERTPWLGPTLIYAFREHHRDPRAMLDHPWTSVNREPGIAAAVGLLLLSLPALAPLLEGHVFVYGFVCSFIAYGASANQLHQWAHMPSPPRPVRLAQRFWLILSPERHARHHRGANTVAYCISTGWLNPTLDAVGFWHKLERGILWIKHRRARTNMSRAENRRLERT